MKALSQFAFPAISPISISKSWVNLASRLTLISNVATLPLEVSSGSSKAIVVSLASTVPSPFAAAV